MTRPTVATTERSLEILREIKERRGATLSVLSDELSLSRSTIHKHLTTLLDHGFLAKEGEQYALGLKFLNYGTHARSQKVEYSLAVETVRTLAEETEEEVDFVVENDGRGIVVHESYHPHSQYQEGSPAATDAINAGTYYHLHSIAAGKAILAELSDESVAAIVERWGLPERTDRTITSLDALREELATVRETGIAYSDEEYADGMRAVGRRVESPTGSLVGSISITGPAYRMTGELFEDRIPSLLDEHIKKLEAEIRDAHPTI